MYQELSLVPNLSVAENIFANRQPVGPQPDPLQRLHHEAAKLLRLFGTEGIDPRTPVGDCPSPSARWWKS